MAWTSASGAASSYEYPRYDLIYWPVLRRLADRLAYGAAKHGEHNYKAGVGDAVYRRDRLNHLIQHAHELAAATTPEAVEKHLGAILANCQILAYLDDHDPSAPPCTST